MDKEIRKGEEEMVIKDREEEEDGVRKIDKERSEVVNMEGNEIK